MDLVTGATGIVGAHVVDALLERGRAVRALFRAGSDREIVRRILRHYHSDGDARAARIDWCEADLFDEQGLRDAMAGVEHVYHCAAVVSFDPRDRKALLRTNIDGTANVVNAALANEVARLCHVSSTATIGPVKGNAPRDERSLFAQDAGSSAYAISKAGAELEVQRGIAEGLDAVMINPCVVIGPGPAGRSSMTMIERLRKGSLAYPVGSNAVVDARDVAEAMVQLVHAGASGERYLVVGENITYKDLFSLVAKQVGRNGPRWVLPAWALELAWRAERIRTLFGGRPLVTQNTARTASVRRSYDDGKLRALLGSRPRSAEEAVANVEAFLAR